MLLCSHIAGGETVGTRRPVIVFAYIRRAVFTKGRRAIIPLPTLEAGGPVRVKCVITPRNVSR